MEIHELNTFSGTLGSGDFFATDNGNDTSKVSAESMFAPLNERIDNIIAGGTAPSAAEVTDARRGASVLGGTQYTSLGNAVRGQVTQLYDYEKKVAEGVTDSTIDLLPFGDMPNSYTSATGITVTKQFDGKLHFEGTVARSSFIGYAENVNDIPFWLKKGHTYALSISGASSNNVIYFDVLGWRNGSTQVQLLNRQYSDGIYLFTLPSDFVGGVFVRVGWLSDYIGRTVNETIEYHLCDITNDNGLLPNGIMHYSYDSYDSCDKVPSNTMVFVSSSGGVLSIPDFPVGGAGNLVTFGYPDFPIQYAFSYEYKVFYSRRKKVNGWTDWQIGSNTVLLNTEYHYDSCDDIKNNCVLFVGSSGGVLDISDAPAIGTLQTFYALDDIVCQILYPYNTDDSILYRRKNVADGWTAWVGIGSGGGETITITQEVSRDTYNNTYDITTSPSITTDTNGWLQPVDTDTESETGKTDMTGAIMSMLTSTGYCHLAEGIFYVSGNIDIPAGATLEGCGRGTIIRLLGSVSSGYICRLKEYGTIKNIRFSGGYNSLDISDSNIGGRKGVIFIGNRDGQDSGVTPSTTKCCQITGCWFENLDSGIYGYNAGGGLQEGLIVSDCYITRCKAGINLDYWTEYCKFTDVVVFQCYYACINNGGNNVFTACTFHGVIGFLIDNSGNNKPNSGHGSVIGCTFNHIDNMNNPGELGKGLGIKVLNTQNGFIFANCQLWYGRVHIENSAGVQITGCEFGGLGGGNYPAIETSGTGMVFIDNCLFNSTPSLSLSGPAKMTNCWTYAGIAVNG